MRHHQIFAHFAAHGHTLIAASTTSAIVNNTNDSTTTHTSIVCHTAALSSTYTTADSIITSDHNLPTNFPFFVFHRECDLVSDAAALPIVRIVSATCDGATIIAITIQASVATNITTAACADHGIPVGTNRSIPVHAYHSFQGGIPTITVIPNTPASILLAISIGDATSATTFRVCVVQLLTFMVIVLSC